MSETNREALLAGAESLIASAVALLHPVCGQHLTVGILAQMAEEQSRLRSAEGAIFADPPTQSRH
jgi:hypothetical protein